MPRKFLLVFFLVLCVSISATPITSGLALWLDASDSNSVVKDVNGYVQQWNDKSGNNNNAYQNTASYRPTLNSTALNGQAAIRFDGSNDGMYIADTLSLNRPYTVFIVDQYYGSIQGRTLQSRDINWLVGLWAGNQGHYASGWVSNSSYNPAGTNNPWISEAIGTASNSYYYADGTNMTVNSSPTGVPGRLALVGSGMYNEQSQADVAEILIYTRVLTTEERNAVGSYLASKYNIDSTYLSTPEPNTLILAAIIALGCFLRRKSH